VRRGKYKIYPVIINLSPLLNSVQSPNQQRTTAYIYQTPLRVLKSQTKYPLSIFLKV
jgi:hypothetical protein